MQAARPNDAHRALASLERSGRVALLVTQNVDGLHQAAGSRNVIDLHGRVDAVGAWAASDACRARTCKRSSRSAIRHCGARRAPRAPDGDADLGRAVDFAAVRVPDLPTRAAAC